MALKAFLFLLLLAASPAFAIEAGEVLADSAQEARARTLSQEIRCVVCQAESVDDSQSLLAQDLRRYIRQGIVAGKTDADIKNELRARYGDQVLLSPPVTPRSLLLWFAPVILLLLAALGARKMLR